MTHAIEDGHGRGLGGYVRFCQCTPEGHWIRDSDPHGRKPVGKDVAIEEALHWVTRDREGVLSALRLLWHRAEESVRRGVEDGQEGKPDPEFYVSKWWAKDFPATSINLRDEDRDAVKQVVAFAMQSATREALERACRAMCISCAEGLPAVPHPTRRFYRAEQDTVQMWFHGEAPDDYQCYASPIRALMPEEGKP